VVERERSTYGYTGRIGEIERKVKEYIDIYSLFDFQ